MDLLHVYDVTCPASTPTSAPVEVQTVPAGLFYVTRFVIVIPDGHSGLTGIALAYGHQPVIPYNAGAYISGNDEVIPYDLSGSYPAGVQWSAFLVNDDLQSHSWEVRCELSIAAPQQSLSQSTLTAADIYTAGQAGILGG